MYSDNYNHGKQNSIEYVIIVSVIMVILILLEILCFTFTICLQISTRKKQENDIINQNLKTSTEMLHYVNHEMRNPLNVVFGNIDISTEELTRLNSILKQTGRRSKNRMRRISDIDIPSIISNLSTAYSQCKLMKHIVDDILDIEKIKAGQMVLEYKIIYLKKLLENTVKTNSIKSQEKPQIKFMVDNKLPEDFYFVSDTYRIDQILMNFTSNAWKFTLEGHIILKVLLLGGTDIRFEIIDSGMGVPETKRTGLFQPFKQAEIEYGTRYGGSGLGLYLCSLIVKTLDGKCGYENLENGSLFWFSIKYIKNLDSIEYV